MVERAWEVASPPPVDATPPDAGAETEGMVPVDIAGLKPPVLGMELDGSGPAVEDNATTPGQTICVQLVDDGERACVVFGPRVIASMVLVDDDDVLFTTDPPNIQIPNPLAATS